MLGAHGGLPDRPISPQAAGLHEGDYIVSLNGQPCKWRRHAEVVAQLRGAGDEGVSLQVASLLPRAEPPSTVSPRGPRSPEGTGKRRLRAHETPAPGRLLGSSPLPSAGLVPTLELQALSRGLHPAPHGARPPGTPGSPLTAQPPPPQSLPGGPRAGRARGAHWDSFLSPQQGHHRPALGALLRSQKECGWGAPTPARAAPRLFLGWSRKARRGKARGRLSPQP